MTKKDVWVTGFLSKDVRHGAGYGGLMARQGLAEAVFGEDRVLVLENKLNPIGTSKDLSEYVNQVIEEALSKHGPPRFIVEGWQDISGKHFTDTLKFKCSEKKFPKPVVIILGVLGQEYYERGDLVIELSVKPSSIQSLKKIVMTGIVHRVNQRTIAASKEIAYYSLPPQMRDQDFITLLVGAPQHDEISNDANLLKVFKSASILDFPLEHDGFLLAQSALNLCAEKGMNLAVITSPRTPNLLTKGIRSALNQEKGSTQTYLHEFVQGDPFNPYPGILGLPNNKLAIVTNDSLSLVCEAVASSLPVTLQSPWPQKVDYSQKIFDEFAQRGLLLPFEHISVQHPAHWQQRKIVFDTTAETAKVVKSRLIRLGLAQQDDFPVQTTDSKQCVI